MTNGTFTQRNAIKILPAGQTFPNAPAIHARMVVLAWMELYRTTVHVQPDSMEQTASLVRYQRVTSVCAEED